MSKAVPHCRFCPLFEDSHVFGQWGRYRCLHSSFHVNWHVFKLIPSTEVRTSPKWCPRRLHDGLK